MLINLIAGLVCLIAFCQAIDAFVANNTVKVVKHDPVSFAAERDQLLSDLGREIDELHSNHLADIDEIIAECQEGLSGLNALS